MRRSILASVSALTLLASPAIAAPPTVGAPFEISPLDYTGNGKAFSPIVGTNGTDFLVCWSGDRYHCARYTASGVLLDPQGIAIATQYPKAVVWDGSAYVVLGGSTGQRIDPLSGAASPVFPLHAPPLDPDIAAGAGDGFVLDVWGDTTAPFFATVTDPTGKIVADNIVLPTSLWGEFAVGYAGGEFLVAATPLAVQAVRISTAGVLLDPSPRTIEGPVPPNEGVDVGAPRVAASGSEFLVLWAQNPPFNTRAGVFASRVALDGTVLDPGGFSITTTAGWGPSVAWTGSSYWVVWGDEWGPGQAIQATSVQTDAAVAPQASIFNADTGRDFTGPAVAANPNARLCAYGDYSDDAGVDSIFGLRTDATGTVIGGSALLSSYLETQDQVVVRASSTGYAAFWTESGERRFTRLLPDGGVIDPTPATIQNPQAFLGTGFYAGMGSGYFGAIPPVNGQAIPVFSLAGAGAGPDGGADGGTGPVTWLGTVGNASAGPSPRAVTCLPDRCLVVWLEGTTTLVFTAQVVSAAGAPLGAPVVLGPYSSGYVVASNDGSGFLVVHETAATPISASGVAATSNDLSDAGVAMPASLVWGGDRYLLLDMGSWSMARLSSDGVLIGAVERTPAPAIPNPFGAGWDGRAFALLYAADGGTVGVELPPSAPSTGLTPFLLFPSGNPGGIDSLMPGMALAVGLRPEGPDGTPRVVATLVGTSDTDAGGDGGGAGDGGASDGGADGGIADGGVDATVSADAGLDATVSTDSGLDATVGADGSPSPVDAAPSEDAAEGGAAPGSANGGGCGCVAAGGSGAEGATSILGVAFAFAAVARRRKSRARR